MKNEYRNDTDVLSHEDTNLHKKIKYIYISQCKAWHATIELTYRCNFNCVHCYCCVDKQRTELDIYDYEILAKDLKELGVITLTITGGEALIRKDIFDILEIFCRHGFIITLFSNGYAISSRVAAKLSELGIKFIEISIYGATDNTYQCVTGKRAYSKINKSFSYLRENNIHIITKAVFLNINAHEADQMIKIGHEYGAMKIEFDPIIFPKIDHNSFPSNYRCTDDQVYSLYLRTLKITDIASDNIIQDDRICSVGGSIVISPYGDVYPCTAFSWNVGNIREKSIAEIWQKSKDLMMMRNLRNADLTKCRSCNYFNFCNVCPGLFYMENKTLLEPAKECCRIAAIKKRAYYDKFY